MCPTDTAVRCRTFSQNLPECMCNAGHHSRPPRRSSWAELHPEPGTMCLGVCAPWFARPGSGGCEECMYVRRIGIYDPRTVKPKWMALTRITSSLLQGHLFHVKQCA